MNVKLKLDILFEGGISLFSDDKPGTSPFMVLLPRHMDIENDCFHVCFNDKYSETINDLHSYMWWAFSGHS